MFKKSKLILPALAGLLVFQACDKLGGNSYKKTTNGLEYQLYAKNKSGKYDTKEAPAASDSTKLNKTGQILRLHMRFANDKDSVIMDTYKSGMAIYVPVTKPTFKGGIEEAFAMVTPGDSGVFKINADSLYGNTFKQPLPKFIKKGSALTFYLKTEKAMAEQEAMMDQQTQMMAFMEKQNKTDEAIIQKYIKDKGLKTQKTNSGIYYVINQPGTGGTPAPGNTVSVGYTGTTLDGKEFDSSYKNPMSGGKPIEFPIGQGAVIRGWDEGIAMLNKGSKATLIIPSTLAYGPQAMDKIPANSVLRFDVELVDIKNTPPVQQPQMQPQVQAQPQR